MRHQGRTLRARVKEGAKQRQAVGGQHQSCGAGGEAVALSREGGAIGTCMPHPKCSTLPPPSAGPERRGSWPGVSETISPSLSSSSLVTLIGLTPLLF